MRRPRAKVPRPVRDRVRLPVAGRARNVSGVPLKAIAALLLVGAIGATGGAPAFAETVPLPRPKPATFAERTPAAAPGVVPGVVSLAPAPELQGLGDPKDLSGPSECERRLRDLAGFTPLPVLVGPGACGARDVIRLESVTMPDKSRVAIQPPATLRCAMAETVAVWVREDIGPAVRTFGSALAAVAAYDSYECRGRNRVVGAKISEHGKANAIDVRGVRLADGRTLAWPDPAVPKEFRERMKATACTRFDTVLGPGSDGYHEQHIHVDLAARPSGYKICQWDVREPGAVATLPANGVPLPPPRPQAAKDSR
jgi:hypothetical protein